MQWGSETENSNTGNILIQVNRSKYLYTQNTGNGTTYILFWYQRTTARDVTECE